MSATGSQAKPSPVVGRWYGTQHQVMRFKKRLTKPTYWLDQLGHTVLGLFCWFPLVLAFVLYREMKQAATGDGEGRPSLTTGWLDPLMDLSFYVLGASITCLLALLLLGL